MSRYDTERGISYWTKNYRTGVEAADPLALDREYEYYDPIYMLPEQGQQWWRARTPGPQAAAPVRGRLQAAGSGPGPAGSRES